MTGADEHTFAGRTDRIWLKEFATQVSRHGWPVGLCHTYLRRFGTDGLFGVEYQELVTDVQRAWELPVTGLLDQRTWDTVFA